MQRVLVLTLLLVAILTVFCLPYLPIAWYDEVMDLDPAARFVLNHSHASIIWPFKDANTLFLANLPLREMPFYIGTWLFGPTIFGIRIVFFAILLLTSFTLYKALKVEISNLWALLLTSLFVLDPGVLEMMRGCRPEVLEALLLFTSVICLQKNWLIGTFLCAIAMAFLHPALWVFAIVLGFYSLIQTSFKNRLLCFALLILSFVLFYFYIQTNWQLFLNQITSSAADHTSNKSIWQKIQQHFTARFLPYWILQPWWLIVFIFSHGIGFVIWKKLAAWQKMLYVAFCLTSLYWCLILVPNYRYSVFLNAFGILILSCCVSIYGLKFKKAYLLFLAPALLALFGRFTISILQLPERKPNTVYAMLAKNIPVNKTLLLGESIGSYWCLQNKNTHFAHLTQPHNAHYSTYNQVYLLTYSIMDLPLVDSLQFKKTSFRLKAKTYRGLKLYKIPNLATFEKITAPYLKKNYISPYF